MCGIVGLVGPAIQSAATLGPALHLLRRRGPDSEGRWSTPGIALGHRRLAVIDRSHAADQPMVDPLGRGVLVYNGELYNDPDLRRDLGAHGWSFRTRSDTETILAALIQWGPHALARMRGMFSLAFFDPATHTLLLARDPLGIKPLYWTHADDRLAFASELPALLSLGLVRPRPDPVTVSAYLTTIRTTLDQRTLYDGVRTLLPGHWLSLDVRNPSETRQVRRFHTPAAASPPDPTEIPAATRECVRRSILAHLRSDVPTCSLLSGGLDSTIVCSVAAEAAADLRTYAAGARGEAADTDLSFAARLAASRGWTHHEAIVTPEGFAERWPAMVADLGVPLSTPNEVAINAVARLLRSEGCIVALSGEGADELFAGYEAPMRSAAAYFESGGTDAPAFLLAEAAWVPTAVKPEVLLPDALSDAHADAELIAHYRELFALASRQDSDPLQATLRVVQQTNLTGLLQRLDTAMMLEGVEGRTPFADVHVAAFANALPLRSKFDPRVAGPAGSKIALRQAFADAVPPEILSRPKSSFPLPFQQWMAPLAPSLRSSDFIRSWFSRAAIETVAAHPAQLWRLAWPMLNLALWAETSLRTPHALSDLSPAAQTR
ncbi:MAG: asparagine synthase (glutamine-hydrolyzing) [Leptolyngbya sp. PLA1]|nr:asparagine synthase (glutamine-hydrolyzing) [Leptolyngbya sp. PLA1]